MSFDAPRVETRHDRGNLGIQGADGNILLPPKGVSKAACFLCRIEAIHERRLPEHRWRAERASPST